MPSRRDTLAATATATLGLAAPAAAAPAADPIAALLATEGSALVPRLSTAKLLAQPENAALRALLTAPPQEPALYRGRRIAMLVTDGVEEIELTAIAQYFRDRGAELHLLSPRRPDYPAMFGVQMPAIRESHILTIRYMDLGGWVRFDQVLEEARAEAYDAAIIPGGAWNPDALRANEAALRFVQAVAARGRPVAALCHGPWVLGDAGLLRGKRATAWWWMRRDVEGAGASFVDAPVVVDGNIVTSRFPGDIPAFVAAVGEALTGRQVAGL